MKNEFKTKFLQHVNNNRSKGGFTLIELLVCIFIIGILSAIGLSAFLRQANKAKESEAKQYLASIAKGQEMYYGENNNTFASSINDLGLGIPTATSNYTYDIGFLSSPNTGVVAYTPSAATGLTKYSSTLYESSPSTLESFGCKNTNPNQPVSFPDGITCIAPWQ